VTFREARDVYIATHASNNRTAYEQERVLRKHLLPALQSKKLSDINYQHVAEIIDRIKTKPAANHLYTETRVFFNWTVKRRYLTTSPLAGSAQPYPSVTRDRVLSHAELRAIWFAAEEIGSPYGKIVQLLFWGQRRGETSKLRWE
jgi:integrase